MQNYRRESAAQISRWQSHVHRTRLPRKKERATTIIYSDDLGIEDLLDTESDDRV